MPSDQALSCDIFCTVIDNLGDAGVCWRLARQLATEYDWQVRLWIDDPAPIALLAPDHAAVPVTVHPWAGDFGGVTPAQIVIEAFACELPPRYVEAMAALPRPPVWLNLEYLSAEDWVAGCHGLPSPHPRLPLVKHFFFPGFVAGTGGLLREKNLAVPPAPTFPGQLEISLFCYDNPALPDLAGRLARRQRKHYLPCGRRPATPPGRSMARRSPSLPAPRVRRGSLNARRPALPPADRIRRRCSPAAS